MAKRCWDWAAVSVCLVLSAGCTFHPAGEREERAAAQSAGRRYEIPIDRRAISPLPPEPAIDDLVQFALLSNADVEQAYWQWRSALEQVPIDGTQATNLALTGSLGISHGRTSLSQATIGVGNDPMADIVLPNKLDAAASRALALARAAGNRFRQSQLDLRAKVIADYDDYALTARFSRLDQQNIQLLSVIVTVTQARNRAGATGQQDVLKAENDLDEARNDLASNDAQLPAQRAALNALLNRAPQFPLPPPEHLPLARSFTVSESDLLAKIERQNLQLAEQTDQVSSRQADIQLARLLYEPDVSFSAGTDLQGIAQTLVGMVTVPILKYEAIHAAVAQAQANLRAADANRRQLSNDLAAEMVEAISQIRDADREIALYEHSILPRARQVVLLTRSNYETGNASLLDVLEGQRSLIDIERLVASTQVSRDKRVAQVETLLGNN
jgi:cobalt-zinc-cadmium efflux system outer membrane protein